MNTIKSQHTIRRSLVSALALAAAFAVPAIKGRFEAGMKACMEAAVRH